MTSTRVSMMQRIPLGPVMRGLLFRIAQFGGPIRSIIQKHHYARRAESGHLKLRVMFEIGLSRLDERRVR